ncbi:hypothetical protein J6590_074506 [Homalodisca vitripennis]|nr:hypothetical protein J6590_074506 [Homalodisca vitripennis]
MGRWLSGDTIVHPENGRHWPHTGTTVADPPTPSVRSIQGQEIAVRCFKNLQGALAKSVLGRAMSSCCGGDRNLPSATDIFRTRCAQTRLTK